MIRIVIPGEPIASFFVPGIPRPGGSKRGIPYQSKATGQWRAAVIEDCARSKDWRAVVALEAARHFRAPLSGALIFAMEFRLPRPKKHFTGRGALKANAPAHHSVPPDTTKLVRSTEDALKGIAWLDDCLVVEQHPSKRYCLPGEGPGCLISIYCAPSADRTDRAARGGDSEVNAAEEQPHPGAEGAGVVPASPRPGLPVEDQRQAGLFDRKERV